jgi:allophanate hydrolase subunit 2
LELLPSRGAGGAVSYLACTGAFAAQRYAGSRSTDLRAGAGGSRRALQAGDVLGVGGAPSGLPRPAAGPLHYPPRVELRIHPGPQHDDEAFAALLHGSFRVAAGDRTGVRLDGPAVPVAAPDVLSEGSMWGAVQVPADGRPIVLLAGRGRTGGYAKPAVVDVRDLWRLAQAGAGSEVWFVAAEGVSAPRRRPG